MKVIKILLVNVVVLVLILALLEGGASLLFTANQVRRTASVSEQSYSAYDSVLGWVSRPNVERPDLYGPGKSLTTNGQGFRNDHDFTSEVPPGKSRVVCSGDSFTLGFGVSDDEAWCRRLELLDPTLETVNMGQGGYGLDQVYLHYLRDGVALKPRVHIVAFITDDFRRMQADRFVGYGKPVLAVRDDSLVIANAPVPRTSAFARWIAVKGHAVTNLNIVRLGYRLFGTGEPSDSVVAARDRTAREVTSGIFATLARVDSAQGTRLLLVYLPGLGEYRRHDGAASWRAFVGAQAERQHIALLDLGDTLRTVRPTEVDALFLPDGHYSAAGNAFVAEKIGAAVRRMLDDPCALRKSCR